jgi:hypothetical protein
MSSHEYLNSCVHVKTMFLYYWALVMISCRNKIASRPQNKLSLSPPITLLTLELVPALVEKYSADTQKTAEKCKTQPQQTDEKFRDSWKNKTVTQQSDPFELRIGVKVITVKLDQPNLGSLLWRLLKHDSK